MTIKAELPSSIETEEYVIGCALWDKAAAQILVDMLTPDHFSSEKLRTIWTTLSAEVRDKGFCDVQLLHDALGAKSELCGGLSYYLALVEAVPTTANAEAHAERLVEYAVRREIVRKAHMMAQLATKTDISVNDIVADVQNQVMRIAGTRKDSSQTMADVMAEWWEDFGVRHEAGGAVTGVRSGFTELDALTLGFQPADLVILAARPSMGKTAFALNLALRSAMRFGTHIALFSLEMPKKQLATRFVSMLSGVSGTNLRLGRLSTDADLRRVSQSLGRLSTLPIRIDDTPAIDVAYMRQVIRRATKQNPVDMVVVDYLQLMSATGENREQAVSSISRGLKALAREFSVPVIALSQLSRAVEQRQDKVPQLSDLRESGSLEQDADLVIFLYREDYYKPETDRIGVTDLIIAKQRNGPIGEIQLYFDKATTTFNDVRRRADDEQSKDVPA